MYTAELTTKLEGSEKAKEIGVLSIKGSRASNLRVDGPKFGLVVYRDPIQKSMVCAIEPLKLYSIVIFNMLKAWRVAHLLHWDSHHHS